MTDNCHFSYRRTFFPSSPLGFSSALRIPKQALVGLTSLIALPVQPRDFTGQRKHHVVSTNLPKAPSPTSRLPKHMREDDKSVLSGSSNLATYRTSFDLSCSGTCSRLELEDFKIPIIEVTATSSTSFFLTYLYSSQAGPVNVSTRWIPR